MKIKDIEGIMIADETIEISGSNNKMVEQIMKHPKYKGVYRK